MPLNKETALPESYNLRRFLFDSGFFFYGDTYKLRFSHGRTLSGYQQLLARMDFIVTAIEGVIRITQSSGITKAEFHLYYWIAFVELYFRVVL